MTPIARPGPSQGIDHRQQSAGAFFNILTVDVYLFAQYNKSGSIHPGFDFDYSNSFNTKNLYLLLFLI